MLQVQRDTGPIGGVWKKFRIQEKSGARVLPARYTLCGWEIRYSPRVKRKTSPLSAGWMEIRYILTCMKQKLPGRSPLILSPRLQERCSMVSPIPNMRTFSSSVQTMTASKKPPLGQRDAGPMSNYFLWLAKFLSA